MNPHKKKAVKKQSKKETKPGNWYSVWSVEEDRDENWGDVTFGIVDKAKEMNLEVKMFQAQGNPFIYVYCSEEEINQLVGSFDEGTCSFHLLDEEPLPEQRKHPFLLLKKNLQSKQKAEKRDKGGKKEKKVSLDEQLRIAIDDYNIVYAQLSDHGISLFNQRERAIDVLGNVEALVNSIANHPKQFDADIAEILLSKRSFRDTCEYARAELEAVQKSAAGVGAGVAGGVAVASLAPGAAMWVATTFGTASTGTAISALSGAAATKAALAWLGGGALSAGGGGIAAGQALLALSGPIGWGIAGASILTSVVLFANKKTKLNKEKKEEIEAVLKNTNQIKEADTQLICLLKKTDSIRNGLCEQYKACMKLYGKSFLDLTDSDQLSLATLVNNAKALAISLSEGISGDANE